MSPATTRADRLAREARRGRLHTKLFREERERPVWLLVDLQPGMFFGTAPAQIGARGARGGAARVVAAPAATASEP